MIQFDAESIKNRIKEKLQSKIHGLIYYFTQQTNA